MPLKKIRFFNFTVIFMVFLCIESDAKLTENRTKINENYPEIKATVTRRVRIQSPDGPATLFAEELKQTLERYLFGICPQTFKSQFSRGKNTTTTSCDVDSEQQDLAGRLATLSLRVHSAARADCSRLGAALASTLGELARTAANRHAITAGAAADANKKRKLSKSQKAKIQAKQRTALAVKKKAAAIAAKTAATSS